MQQTTIKQEAHKLVDQLPDAATWKDLAHLATVRADIEAGLADSAADRVTPAEDVLKEFGLLDDQRMSSGWLVPSSDYLNSRTI